MCGDRYCSMQISHEIRDIAQSEAAKIAEEGMSKMSEEFKHKVGERESGATRVGREMKNGLDCGVVTAALTMLSSCPVLLCARSSQGAEIYL